MAFYYFDLVGEKTFADAGGCDCKGLNHAKEIAMGLGMRLATKRPELVGKGYAIIVRSHDDEEVYRIGIDALNKSLAH